MNYFISAGEASGDLHASHLIAELRKLDSEARFTFLGGDKMAAEAAARPIIHYSDMAYMGFSQVVKHLPAMLGNLSRARKALREERPDALILVDYPDFNLRLAKEAGRLGIPVYYFIAPKAWAWKSGRVKKLKALCRKVFSILPFEEEWFGKRGLRVDYVGNPSVAEIDGAIASLLSRADFIADHDLTSRPILGLVPGSRRGEIASNLPVMQAVARARRDMQPVVAAAPGVPIEFYRRYTTLPVVKERTLDVMKYSHAALVTSGTATLECALAGTPQVVCYRSNGSRLTYALMRRILKISHVSLPNLIAGRTIIPEMLLHNCSPRKVYEALEPLINDPQARRAQTDGYRRMRESLGTENAAANAAAAIVADLKTLRK